jgi:parallel beta-helix repeat protein
MIHRNFSTLILLAMALLLAGPKAARAAESYDNCTGFITSLPAVISTQGTWCLKQDLNTAIATGKAITIATNNVTLDCNDFKIGGLAAGTGTQTFGIYAIDRSNATVRHCSIRGFRYGILFGSSDPFTSPGGHTIEDNRLDGNTLVGIYVTGDGSTIQRNRVFDTGQTTTSATVYGIFAQYSVDVLDNTVTGVVARTASNGSAIGISTLISAGGSISGNRLRGLLKDGTGLEEGIVSDSDYNLAIRNNDLAGNATTGSVGIECNNNYNAISGPTDNGTTKNNVINGFVTGIQGCSDDSGNVLAP